MDLDKLRIELPKRILDLRVWIPEVICHKSLYYLCQNRSESRTDSKSEPKLKKLSYLKDIWIRVSLLFLGLSSWVCILYGSNELRLILSRAIEILWLFKYRVFLGFTSQLTNDPNFVIKRAVIRILSSWMLSAHLLTAPVLRVLCDCARVALQVLCLDSNLLCP